MMRVLLIRAENGQTPSRRGTNDGTREVKKIGLDGDGGGHHRGKRTIDTVMRVMAGEDALIQDPRFRVDLELLMRSVK